MLAALLATLAMTSTLGLPEGTLMTRWAKHVSAVAPHSEYPRPQLVRPNWTNLNGPWEYAIAPVGEAQRPATQGKILVPFPIESALSGVGKRVSEKEALWTWRKFNLKQKPARMMLHFGAVDYRCSVELNGKRIGEHVGGYDAFSFDVTDALIEGENELVVRAEDSTGDFQPRGKQWRKPEGIWYTPVTGIWQTVWLEPLPEVALSKLDIRPDLDASAVHVSLRISGVATAEVAILDGRKIVAVENVVSVGANTVSLPIRSPKLWTPETPFLYGVRVRVSVDGKVVDTVSSYFGMRSSTLVRDEKGIVRLGLNGRAVFQVGPLDQGFWPDGIYVAPTDDALRFDIEMTKKLGFNTIRKHVKVEPARWYYWADRLGILVWQDMPSPHFDGEKQPDEAQKKQFLAELGAMIDGLRNHPSIVMWVPFNEGWGQHDTEKVVEFVRAADPTRLVNNASGWTDMKVGDTMDIHHYPAPAAPANEPNRAAVLGEFGGLGLAIDGHTWSKQNWGYQGMSDRAALTDKYVRFLKQAYELNAKGLAAAIYTQTTDVETETNGLLTYDREIVKIDLGRVARANRGDFRGLVEPKVIVPTSQAEGLEWRYTLEAPSGDWFAPAFEVGSWKTGPGGFGIQETPGSVVRTEWRTSDIWLRREFTLPKVALRKPMLRLHHDDDVEVYLNGVLAFKRTGWTSSYEDFAITSEALATLKPGASNTIAIHCHQNRGGQYIDAGLVD